MIAVPTACRLCKRKQQLSLPARRQMGYAAGTGKKDDKRHVLLTEDVAEALKDVRGLGLTLHIASLPVVVRTVC